MESNFKVQNPSDLCLVLLVGGIYLSGGENKCSVFGEELQTASDRSRHSFLELPEKIKVPRKGHQNNLLKKTKKEKTEDILF